MKRILQICLMVVIIPWVFVHPVFGQDTLKIETGTLDIRVSVRTGTSFLTYMGSGTEISAPHNPFGGMSAMIMLKDDDGNSHTYVAGETKVKGGDSVLVKVKCKVKNVSGSVQSFEIGDISITVDILKADFHAFGLEEKESSDQDKVEKMSFRSDFHAIGLGEYVFVKESSDRDKVKKKVFKLEPNDDVGITYVFMCPKCSPSWKLTYKGSKYVELKGKE